MDEKKNRLLLTSKVRYKDDLDFAKKLLHIYNGLLMAISEDEDDEQKKRMMSIPKRHMNLLSFYLVFGFSRDTVERYARVFNVPERYVAVMNTELKIAGFLVDRRGSAASRELSPALVKLKQYMIENKPQIGENHAMVFTFHRISGADLI